MSLGSLVPLAIVTTLTLQNNGIEGCHPLPQKSEKLAITLPFVDRKQKNVFLRQERKIKGSNMHVIPDLTRKNADIARRAQFLRKQSKIQSTWTANCKVFIKLNGTPEETKVVVIREIAEVPVITPGSAAHQRNDSTEHFSFI